MRAIISLPSLILILTLCFGVTKIQAEQQIVCWGDSIPVQNGVFSNGIVIIPNLILTNAIRVAGCLDGGIILNKDGTLQGWAGGIREGLSNIVSIAAWESSYIALDKSGKAFYWGEKQSGELEGVASVIQGPLVLTTDGTVANINGRANSLFKSASLKSVAVGGNKKQHRVGLNKNGSVFEWTTVGGEIQERVLPFVTNEVVTVEAAPRHNLALKNDGTVIEWTNSGNSKTTVVASNGLVLIDGRVLTNIIAIAAGGTEAPPMNEFSLALLDNGSVVGWGTLGWRPLVVPNKLSNIVAIAAADTYCLAVQEIK